MTVIDEGEETIYHDKVRNGFAVVERRSILTFLMNGNLEVIYKIIQIFLIVHFILNIF